MYVPVFCIGDFAALSHQTVQEEFHSSNPKSGRNIASERFCGKHNKCFSLIRIYFFFKYGTQRFVSLGVDVSIDKMLLQQVLDLLICILVV